MEEWKTYRLGDIITISSGFPYKGEFIGKGNNYLLGMGCVSFKEKFLKSGLRQYSGDAPERYIAHPGDIVLATRQQSDNLPILGMPAIIPQAYNGYKMIIGANLYKVQNESEFSNAYIYWLMKSPAYVDHIKSCQTGTTVRMITKANIENFTFKAPEKSERDKIASFLWNIEEKIAINRQINDNLEQQAQTLYKSWFVDFEPFKDGEFIESELGQIPEGWQCIPFSMFVSESKAKTGKIGIKEYSVTNNGIFPRDAKYNKSLSQSSIKNKLILYGDLVFGMSRDILNWGVMQEEQGGVSSAYTVYNINSGIVNSTYLELFIKSRIHLFSDLIRPAAREGQGIDKSVLQTKVLLYPPQKVLDTFWPLYNSVTNQIQTTTSEINCLGDVRDTLLPKLMSGELKINEIDC